jgi:hypothetical protein
MTDRLVGLVGTFMAAILTKRAFGYVDKQHSSNLVSIAWNVNNVPVTNTAPIISETRLMKEVSHHHWEVENQNGGKDLWVYLINEDKDIVPQIRNGSLLLEEFIPRHYETVVFVNQYGFTIKVFDVKEYHSILKASLLTPESAFGCLFDYFFQPKPEIFIQNFDHFKKFMNSDESGKTLKIGIHLRAGDEVFKKNHSSFNVARFDFLFKCAEQIESWAMRKGGYTNSLWYVISDNREFRELAIKEYSSHNVYTMPNSTIVHGFLGYLHHHKLNSAEGGEGDVHHGVQQAAAEWWLYGLMDYHVAGRTGYATAAAYRKTYRNNLFFGSPFRECSEHNFEPVSRFGEYLPGI